MREISLDTIVALATPSGRGGVAIIRISGNLVKSIALQILGELPKPRYAHLSPFLDTDSSAMDEGLALFFPNPHSFTGEDVLELHGHGGIAVVDLLLKRIITLGARLAKPGEFSERAFLNGKLDLTQAEAIADLINAASYQAARASVRSLQGEFSKKIHALVEKIIHLRMYVEASIDFVEEEIDFLADVQIRDGLELIFQNLQKIEAGAMQGSLLREGITVVIMGEPNVGKSSLLNRLSEKDVAIVTDIPGTTRDVLRQEIHIDGLPVHIIDTAGIRESTDIVEQEGIRRAKEEIARADVLLHVVDKKTTPAYPNAMLIINKIDLNQQLPSATNSVIALSAKTGEGVELLKNYLKQQAGFNSHSEGVFSARRRHLNALTRAKEFLSLAKTQTVGELLAEELRQAQNCLNEITGEFTTDDLLGRIFSNFCVGK